MAADLFAHVCAYPVPIRIWDLEWKSDHMISRIGGLLSRDNTRHVAICF